MCVRVLYGVAVASTHPLSLEADVGWIELKWAVIGAITTAAVWTTLVRRTKETATQMSSAQKGCAAATTIAHGMATVTQTALLCMDDTRSLIRVCCVFGV